MIASSQHLGRLLLATRTALAAHFPFTSKDLDLIVAGRCAARGSIMPFGNPHARALHRCPGGTSDSSPAFQRRERGPMRLSPDGTVEWKQTGVAIQPPLRASAEFVR